MTGIRVGGVPLRSLGYWGDLSWSHTWPGGCAEASWGMAGLARGVAHPILKRGAPVEVTVGTKRVWKGVLDQPDAGLGSFMARGLSREAERYTALDGSGNPTYDTLAAVTQAVTNGLPWTVNNADLPAGVATDKVETVSSLLDFSATAASKRWGVDADGRFFLASDPTAVSYHIVPGSVTLGQADDDYATHIYGRYVSAMSGTPPVASAWALATASDVNAATIYGRSDRFVDLTPRGLLTATAAGNIVAGMLAQGRARVGFTERLEVNEYQILTADGTPAGLPFIKAGEMVRVHGAISPGQSMTNGPFADLVIGETNYAAGSRSITLAPLGLAPRTLADILAVTPIQESVA